MGGPKGNIWHVKKISIIPKVLVLFCLISCQGIIKYGVNRVLDLGDCIKGNVGYGVGLTLEIKATDWFAPGLGYMSYQKVFGWDCRGRFGAWEEWVVINTPRSVWELSFGENAGPGGLESNNQPSTVSMVKLALASVFLANERWVREPFTKKVSIELYSLFNFSNLSKYWRLVDPSNTLLEKGEIAEITEKRIWEKGFVEIAATLGFVHFRVGMNLFESIDFIFGFFGLDLAGDDL